MEFNMKTAPLDKPLSTAPVANDRKAAGPAANAAAGGADAPSAHVALSPAARAATEGAEGSFDAEKVARIAQAIRDGKFEVNAEAIADKLIANAQELVGKTAN
jgi:negative regulator of flagellin synthesis FlgM